MENSISVQIPFTQPPAEPSDNFASHSSVNGYKATQLIKESFTLNKDYDIISYLSDSCSKNRTHTNQALPRFKP